MSLVASAATRIQLVLPHGIAPWSFAYRAKALLLSYRRRIHATFLVGPARGGRNTAALMRLIGLNFQFGLYDLL